jgi:hypothetical protein
MRSRPTSEMALSGRCIATTSISLGVQANGIFEVDGAAAIETALLTELNNPTLGIVQRGDDRLCIGQQRIECRSVA